MRNIVVEGIDATGKSTLVRYLSARLQMPTQWGEGIPASTQEINDRVRRYLAKVNTIFDRHPVVSNHIYSITHDSEMLVEAGLADSFYESDPILIYCDPGSRRPMADHVVKDHDDISHLLTVSANYPQILRDYRQWAIQHAHHIYRIGDDSLVLAKSLEIALGRNPLVTRECGTGVTEVFG